MTSWPASSRDMCQHYTATSVISPGQYCLSYYPGNIARHANLHQIYFTPQSPLHDISDISAPKHIS